MQSGRLLLFICSSIIGLLIFTKGFLLSRQSLSDKSTITAKLDASFNRTILLVLDGLRYDFIETQEHPNDYHHNKFANVQKLISQTMNGRLFRFIADPPTTTMQRLKGLTTGSLPTFVDAGSNFASSEIDEDNIIDSLTNSDGNIVLMGDDTWESLFPNRFLRSYPYPSFNVHDLHTVDRGVISHIFDEMKKDDWTMIIGHFLGIDHCGHRYGPNHPAMSEKMKEIDSVIGEVVSLMSNDTLLIILGDHGMTKSGDHGGDSESEINAALVLYSKTSFLHADRISTEISQIDLVPTLATLLSVPIPFSNLGSIIIDVFNQDIQLIEALRTTYQQISTYLETYASVSNDLPLAEMSRLREMELHLHKTPEDYKRVITRYIKYIAYAKTMCQNVWARFDDLLMQSGMLLTLFTLVLHIFIQMEFVTSVNRAYVCQALLTSEVLFLCYMDLTPLYNYIIITFTFFIMAAYCLDYQNVKALYERIRVTALFMCTAVIMGLFLAIPLSNSLVVYEDSVLQFLTQSSLILVFCKITSQKNLDEKRGRNLTAHKYSAAAVMLLMSAVGLSSLFYTCREENIDCDIPMLSKPMASLPPEMKSYMSMRFLFLTLPCLWMFVYAIRRILKVRGNANGTSIWTSFISYGLIISCLILTLHWIMSTAPNSSEHIRHVFARMIYIVVLVSLFYLFYNPLTVFLDKPDKTKKTITLNGGEPTVADLYKFLRTQNQDQTTPKSKPVIFGLGSVYSSSYLIMMAILYLLISMLLGDGMMLSTLLLFVSIIVLLDLYKLSLNATSSEIGAPSFNFLLVYTFLSSHFFYATGHQQTMPNIQWDAAFQGFSDHGTNHIIPTILLFISTFTSQVVFSLLLPLFVIIPYTEHYFIQSIINSGQQQKTGLAEVRFNMSTDDKSYSTLYSTIKTYLIIHLLKSSSSMLAAFILRRHLMVWKIFAPSFVFEGAAFIVVCLTTMCGYLLYYRISKSVNSFLENIEIDHVE